LALAGVLFHINMADYENATNPEAQAIIDGFQINWISLRDFGSGRVLWRSQDTWNLNAVMTAEVPAEILSCSTVAREINFTSMAAIQNFSVQQKVKLHGEILEEWDFYFGFVIPGSTNTWEQMIDAAPPDQMLPAEILSGNVFIDTYFYDGETLVNKSTVNIFYV
jgi:retinal rod rhodopsin-sensitive cGMP 3',5'-cyclic phosphodiesterase subunit delta